MITPLSKLGIERNFLDSLKGIYEKLLLTSYLMVRVCAHVPKTRNQARMAHRC